MKMPWSTSILAATLAGALVLAGAAPAVAGAAAEAPSPVVTSSQVSAPAISNVVVVGDATGFSIDFDYEQPHDGWSPVALGVYDGTSSQYPFATSTFTTHNLGTNGHAGTFTGVDDTVVPYPDKIGHVSRSYVHSRSGPVTVMLFAAERACDCSLGLTFVAGATIAPTPPVVKALTVTPLPKLSGTVKVGSTLTVTPGAWAPAPVALAYRWALDGVTVAGATKATFTLPPSAAGKKVTASVSGTKTGYATVTKTSPATAPVARSLTGTPVPKLSGAVTVGSTLTVTPGTWAPAPVALSYQWSVNGVVVAGARGRTFVLPASAAGKKVTATATSSATLPVSRTLTATPVPKLSGTVRAGSTLTVTPGSWAPAPVALRYQWSLNGVVMKGATTRTMTLPASAVGKKVTVSVTGSKTGYAAVTKTSSPTAAVKPRA
jgi:hypothetical protein